MNTIQLKSWLQSSMNPEQVSNTIRGLGTTLAGAILLVLALSMHPTGADQLSAVVDQVAALGGQLAGGIGAAWTLYGLVMKLVMWLGSKPQQ